MGQSAITKQLNDILGHPLSNQNTFGTKVNNRGQYNSNIKFYKWQIQI